MMAEPENNEAPRRQGRAEFGLMVNPPTVTVEDNTHDAEGNPVPKDYPPSDPEE